MILLSESSVVNNVPYVKKVGNQHQQYIYQEEQDWRMFSCKYCQMWIFCVENQDKRIALPLNNLVIDAKDRAGAGGSKKHKRSRFGYHRRINEDAVMNKGLLSFRNGPKVSIKAPVLRKIGLEDLYF